MNVYHHSAVILRYLKTIVILGVCCVSPYSAAEDFSYDGKKVLHINSYHSGYPWSDGIERGIKSRFLVENVWFKTHYMDAKRERTPEAISAAAKDAKLAIDNLQPDVVIVSDDVAARYVLQSDYKNVDIPFVYCGINWDASVYGLPYKNTTGMVEVNLLESLVDLLSKYAGGKKIGFLSIDALSGHRTLEHYQRVLNREFDRAYFANNVEEWQAAFIGLQQQVDYMILANPDGIAGWKAAGALSFINQQVKIPIGSAHEWLAPYSLITIAKIPEEQGWWAAEQALKILRGASPADIPESKNRQGKLFANMGMAHKLDITLSAEILQTAILVGK